MMYREPEHPKSQEQKEAWIESRIERQVNETGTDKFMQEWDYHELYEMFGVARYNQNGTISIREIMSALHGVGGENGPTEYPSFWEEEVEAWLEYHEGYDFDTIEQYR